MFRFAASLLLFVLTSAPGTLLWEVKPGARDMGALTESGGVLIAGNVTSVGGIFAYAPETGKLLWSHRGEQVHAGTAGDGQRAFAILNGSTGHRLAAFDLKTGKELWSHPSEGRMSTDIPAPVTDGGRVYLLTQDSHLDAYNAASGALVYRFAYAPEDPVCPTGLVLAKDRMYFGGGQHEGHNSAGKFLWAVDAASGKEVWRYQSHLVASYLSDCYTTPAVSGDTVVVTSGNSILALRASTGALLWTRKTEGVSGGYPKPYPLSAPVIANGVVYAARRGAIESWNLADGKVLPPYAVEFGADPERVHLYVDGNTMFFLGDLASDAGPAGRHPLHAMDLPTHRILWTHRVNRDVRFVDTWSTSEILVTPTAVYYDNNSLIAKVAR